MDKFGAIWCARHFCGHHIFHVNSLSFSEFFEERYPLIHFRVASLGNDATLYNSLIKQAIKGVNTHIKVS